MTLRQDLYEKFFEEPLETEAQDKEEARVQTQWLEHPETIRMRKWLLDALDATEVSAGPHDSMLAQVGLRDGLRTVQDYFQRIELQTKE